LGIAFDKDDNPVQMKALEEFLDYFDKNYDVFIRIVHDLMVRILWSAAEEAAKGMKRYKETLPGLEGLGTSYRRGDQPFSNMRPMSENRKRIKIKMKVSRK